MNDYENTGKSLIRLIQKERIRSPIYKDKRLYIDFSCIVDDVGKTLVAGFPAGCNLNCYYCFSFTKDFVNKNPMKYIPPPAYKDIERNLKFYSPSEAFQKMVETRDQKYISRIGSYESRNFDPDREIIYFTLRGCEPTLSPLHLFSLLDEIKRHNLKFVLETNGIILARNPDYLKRLTLYRDNLYIGLTIKAGTEENFRKYTGQPGSLLTYQYNFVKYLVNNFIDFTVMYMCGSKFGNEYEEKIILKKLSEYGLNDREKIIKRDYMPFFVPEYKKKGAISLKEII
ncbi:MAG: radical SAM protein [Spirochaetales bacterium]|nr:radical SAM protein [Spirochaetales bacterium]